MNAAPKDFEWPLERARRNWLPLRVVQRYLLFQLPEWAGVVAVLAVGSRWFDLPHWIVIAVPLAWVVKDLLLFPVVWQAYSTEPGRLVGEGALMGARGLALAELAPSGYIRVGSELWRAELETGESTVPEGARVRVCGIRGLTLRVQGERREAMPCRRPGTGLRSEA